MIYYTETSPLPRLRTNLSAAEVMPGIIALFDELGYTDKVIQLPADLIELLSLLDGNRDARFLQSQATQAERYFHMEQFLNMVNSLEQGYFLESDRFTAHQEKTNRAYNEMPARPALHAGSSYPADPDELRKQLDEYLDSDDTNHTEQPPPIAIIAPHIDFRVGGESYAPAYNALKTSEADTFIIFGVSHRMSYDTFMISRKDFETPLGTVPADTEFIDTFRRSLPFELTTNEIAHKQEHSIEFQTVMLRHIFPDRNIRIVPILAGSLYEYVEFGDGNASDDERLTTLYETLAETVKKLERNVCYIAGADLCHIGKKFGDTFPAASILEKIREHDTALLKHTEEPSPENFLKALAAVNNQHRVCGVAPIYATLRTAKPASGKVLCYDQWDETEQESAVSYASVALYG